MTALPQQRPRRLSADEFAALPEDSGAHYELQEGAVVVSPRGTFTTDRPFPVRLDLDSLS